MYFHHLFFSQQQIARNAAPFTNNMTLVIPHITNALSPSRFQGKKNQKKLLKLLPTCHKVTWQSINFLCLSYFKISSRLCSGYYSVKNLHCSTKDKTIAQIFSLWMDYTYFSSPVQYFYVRFGLFILETWTFYDKQQSFAVWYYFLEIWRKLPCFFFPLFITLLLVWNRVLFIILSKS